MFLLARTVVSLIVLPVEVFPLSHILNGRDALHYNQIIPQKQLNERLIQL